MSNYRLEFAVVKNSQKQDVHLDSMNVEVAKSFMVFLDSMTKIAELQPLTSDFKIKITEGSACIAIEAPENDAEEFDQEIFNVFENRSTNKHYVDLLNKMKSTIKANGLEYRAEVVKGTVRTPIINMFRQGNPFKTQGAVRTKANYNLEFLSGKLLEVGGKKPNFHVEINNGNILTIQCSEEEAKKINRLLYQNINISVWRKTTSKSELFFCDNYLNEDVYTDFKSFLKINNLQEGIEKYNQIHVKIVEFITNKDFGLVKKFIQLFNHDTTENGKLRTILITLKSFKEEEVLRKTLEEIATILRQKSGRKSI